ncbi:hypothetical protein R80B4_01911 [Fibrobacteres bacterium R8-0-B4]
METTLKGKTLRKGSNVAGRCGGVPAGWVAEDNLAVFFAKLAVAREGEALPLYEFDFNKSPYIPIFSFNASGVNGLTM